MRESYAALKKVLALESLTSLRGATMGTTVPKGFPLIRGVRWFNVAVLTITPAIGFYGIFHASARRETILFSAAYFIFTMLGKCCLAFLQG